MQFSDPNPKGDYYLRINNLRDEYIFRKLSFKDNKPQVKA